jgi:hypothetical protein
MLKIFDNDVFNAKDAYKAQKIYCEHHNLPMFAPEICHGSMVTIHGPHNPFDHISVNYASLNHIVDCPVCRKSICD